MTKVRDLSGKTFGFLTVVKRDGSCLKTQKAMWLCKCKCGTERAFVGRSLVSGNTTSCGCYRPNQVKDIVGDRYGRLTVIKFYDKQNESARFICKCDCGEEIVAYSNNLRKGITSSCGCFRRQALSERGFLKEEHKSRTYICWNSMKSRVCHNLFYIRRGITICEGYRFNYKTFKEDLGPENPLKPTVDRIDNNLGYFCGKCEECIEAGNPMNIRWADGKMQSNNTSRNRQITHDGKTQTLSEWAREVGMNRETLYFRIYKFNWPIKKALYARGKLALK